MTIIKTPLSICWFFCTGIYKKCSVRLSRRHSTLKSFFFPMPPHVRIDFVVLPPGCGRSVTDVWGWGAHRAQLRCPCDVSDDTYERGVTRGALKPKFYRLPRPSSLWGSSSAREHSHGRTRNQIRDLMASSQKFWPPGHEASHIKK
jgi:hypothetical protein